MTKMGSRLKWTLPLVLVSSLALAALGRMSGFVKDAGGSPIAGAKLTFKHQQQGFERTVTTDDKGKYLISTLPFGAIEISISAPGFVTYGDEFALTADMGPMTKDFKLGREGEVPKAAAVIEGLTPELAKALDDANEAVVAEDHAKAAQIYETARATVGDHPILLMGLAQAHLRTKNNAKAEEVLKAALALTPVPAGAHFYLGNIYASQGKKEMALKEFQAEVVVSPGSDRAYYNLGAMSWDMGKKDDAITALEKAKSINPENREAAALLASVYAATGDVSKARATGAMDSTALYNLGIKQYNDKKDKEALQTFQNVAAADPSHAKAHRMMGLTYVRMGDLAKAKECFHKAVEADPKDADSRQMLKELGE